MWGRRGSCFFCSLPWSEGEQEVAFILNTFFSSLCPFPPQLFCLGAFSNAADSLGQEIFLGASPQTPTFRDARMIVG